jgi:uncharacterized protein (TIGR02246 family)
MPSADTAVRNRLAEIAHAADDGRTDDYIEMFAPGAVWQVPSGTYTGREQIRKVLEDIAPQQPQRHVLANTAVVENSDHVSATTDFVFMVYEKSGWVIAAVGRYHDEFEEQDGSWKLRRRSVRDQTPAAYMPTR